MYNTGQNRLVGSSGSMQIANPRVIAEAVDVDPDLIYDPLEERPGVRALVSEYGVRGAASQLYRDHFLRNPPNRFLLSYRGYRPPRLSYNASFARRAFVNIPNYNYLVLGLSDPVHAHEILAQMLQNGTLRVSNVGERSLMNSARVFSEDLILGKLVGFFPPNNRSFIRLYQTSEGSIFYYLRLNRGVVEFWTEDTWLNINAERLELFPVRLHVPEMPDARFDLYKFSEELTDEHIFDPDAAREYLEQRGILTLTDAEVIYAREHQLPVGRIGFINAERAVASFGLIFPGMNAAFFYIPDQGSDADIVYGSNSSSRWNDRNTEHLALLNSEDRLRLIRRTIERRALHVTHDWARSLSAPNVIIDRARMISFLRNADYLFYDSNEGLMPGERIIAIDIVADNEQDFLEYINEARAEQSSTGLAKDAPQVVIARYVSSIEVDLDSDTVYVIEPTNGTVANPEYPVILNRGPYGRSGNGNSRILSRINLSVLLIAREQYGMEIENLIIERITEALGENRSRNPLVMDRSRYSAELAVLREHVVSEWIGSYRAGEYALNMAIDHVIADAESERRYREIFEGFTREERSEIRNRRSRRDSRPFERSHATVPRI